MKIANVNDTRLVGVGKNLVEQTMGTKSKKFVSNEAYEKKHGVKRNRDLTGSATIPVGYDFTFPKKVKTVVKESEK